MWNSREKPSCPKGVKVVHVKSNFIYKVAVHKKSYLITYRVGINQSLPQRLVLLVSC